MIRGNPGNKPYQEPLQKLNRALNVIVLSLTNILIKSCKLEDLVKHVTKILHIKEATAEITGKVSKYLSFV